MTSTQLIVLIALASAAALLYGRTRVKRTQQAATEQHLKVRQSDIQLIIDRLGEVLKDPSTTTSQGRAAAQDAVAELRRLNPDGSLDALIVDTEAFVAEWLASRQSA